mgnify:CR=1 FL=1
MLTQLKREAQDNEVSDEYLLALFKLIESQYSAEIDRIYNALNDFEFEQAEQFIDALLLNIQPNH